MTTATLGIAVTSNADKASIDLDRLAASAGRAEAGADRFAAASMRASAATQQMSLNSANVAAQLQDVVVSAQMGMNPMMVALQQGTQLSAVLNQVRAGGMGVGAALVASFTSIINPLSLVTIGLIAVGTYALQALGSITTGAASATDAIDEHAKRIGDIVKGYKDAEGAVRDWAEEAQRAPRAVIESNLAKAWQDAMREVEQLQRRAGNMSGSLLLLGGVGDEANAAIQSMREMLALYSRGQMSAQDLQIAMTKIANTDFGFINGAINDMARGFADSADKAAALYDLYIALQHAAAASAVNGGTQIGLDSYVEGQRSAEAHKIEMDALKAKTPAQQRDIAMRRERLKLIDDEITETLREQKIKEAGELAYARAQVAAARSGAKSYDAFGNSLRSAQERLATQQMEIEMFGQSTAALETMRVSQELTNQAKQAGIDLNSMLAGSEMTVAEAIAQTAEQSGVAAQEMERLQYQQQQIDQLNNALASGFANLFIGIIDGSKSAAEGIGDLLKSLGNLLINQAFQSLFAPTAVGGGGFSIANLFGGARAAGGPVQAGKIYAVNENTPHTEYFAPAVNGTILTAQQVAGAAMGAMGGRQGVDVRVSVDRSGNLVAVARQIAAEEVDRYDRFRVPYRVHSLKNNSVPVVG